MSDKYNLDRYLVISVINVESGFNEKEISQKGAKGLMQIIDSTAEYVAGRLSIKEYDIFNVKTNIEFGCYYLRYLLDRFNKEETALLAYNAGEGNVSEWLENNEYSEDGITVKNIPFKESEEYLKKIKKSLSVYRKLYKNIVDK